MLARPMRAVPRSRALVRFNSSSAPSASAGTGQPAARKRPSIPMATMFGDIKIRNLNKSDVELDLLGSLGLEGGTSLAARLAARRRQQQGQDRNEANTEPSKANNASRAPPRLNSAGTPRPNSDRHSFAPRGERRRNEDVRAQGRGREGQMRRDDNNNRAPRSERQPRARRTRENSSMGDEASEEVEAPRPHVEFHVQDDGNKIAVTVSELDKLFAGTISSDPTALAVSLRPQGRNLQNEGVARRTQHILEKRGGDYSRYLPADLGTSFPEQLGPLGSARLVLGHRPDVGLKSRERLLGTVQSLVVNKVVEGQPAANA